MGTHASGPSSVKDKGNFSLKDHLNNEDLPFLFKVLSVRTALSIQAHPDLVLARHLHTSDPKNYRDANHKPEMAIALDEFEALCGFRPVEEISRFARKYKGFSDLISGIEVKDRESLQTAFEKLMKSSSCEIAAAINLMPADDTDPIVSLFHRLNSQYPGDVGIFCVFFLNHFTLNPGQAVFLAANEPHAYLQGSCIECMATSDNVVRAGLTPKHRDVEVLCSMLTYNTFQGLEDLLTIPQRIAGRPAAQLYKSPVPEFSVIRIELEGITGEDQCQDADQIGRSIIICTEGSASIITAGTKTKTIDLKVGSVLYLPAKSQFTIKNKTIEGKRTTLYQAFHPIK